MEPRFSLSWAPGAQLPRCVALSSKAAPRFSAEKPEALPLGRLKRSSARLVVMTTALLFGRATVNSTAGSAELADSKIRLGSSTKRRSASHSSRKSDSVSTDIRAGPDSTRLPPLPAPAAALLIADADSAATGLVALATDASTSRATVPAHILRNGSSSKPALCPEPPLRASEDRSACMAKTERAGAKKTKRSRIPGERVVAGPRAGQMGSSAGLPAQVQL